MINATIREYLYHKPVKHSQFAWVYVKVVSAILRKHMTWKYCRFLLTIFCVNTTHRYIHTFTLTNHPLFGSISSSQVNHTAIIQSNKYSHPFLLHSDTHPFSFSQDCCSLCSRCIHTHRHTHTHTHNCTHTETHKHTHTHTQGEVSLVRNQLLLYPQCRSHQANKPIETMTGLLGLRKTSLRDGNRVEKHRSIKMTVVAQLSF